jgi:cytochrome c556
MKRTAAALMILASGLVAAGGAAQSGAVEDAPATDLSEDLRALLQREMAGLAGAGRAVEDAIARGDSAAVAANARKMEKAFIFEDDISTVDLRELELVLGEDFVARDKAFHASGRALEAAAKAGDLTGQKVIFRDMLEACAACHRAYAPTAPVLEQ